MIPALEALPYFVWVNWDEVVPILDDGTGPIEPAGDYAEVWARNKREAKWAGYRLMKDWPKQQRWEGVHPLHGVKASLAVCPHGLCLLDETVDETVDCTECADEWRLAEQQSLAESQGAVAF